jgi:type I thyroxine 5'-deiodinase
VPALNELYRGYNDRVAFYVVYIQEAHPTDAWQLQSNIKDNVLVATTRTDAERLAVAGSCVKNLGIEFPALVDGSDDAVEVAYTGWPDRLYAVGTDGRIAYKSGPGPFGFDTDELGAALRKLVGEPVPAPEPDPNTAPADA